MDSEAIALLACAISAPICAALLKFLPANQKQTPEQDQKDVVAKDLCDSKHETVNQRLHSIEEYLDEARRTKQL